MITLIHNADLIATRLDNRQQRFDELRAASVLIDNGLIVATGAADTVRQQAQALADQRSGGSLHIVDARGCVVIPGIINTHHHMYQTLTRAIPAAQDAPLFGWLKTLYPLWMRMTPEMARVSALTAMAELLLSGCTTSSDHLYLYPNGVSLTDTIEAAHQIGMRFHAMRGVMTVGESDGGLPPDAAVEKPQAALDDAQRLIEAHHDKGRYAMLRVGLAPCSPFSVSRDFMRESAVLARDLGVRLHTHLAEDDDDVRYSLAKFGRTPAQYAEDLGWLGDDVWHAHCVKLDAHGIGRFAATGTGVAHCPCSNMRLASGIAPVASMLSAGVPVGLGVDGSASNDSGDLLAEARQAMLLARLGQRQASDPGQPFTQPLFSARAALALATTGSAQVLGRDDVGALEPGYAADLAIFDLHDAAYAGAGHDPLAALLFCAPRRARDVFVQGRQVVEQGRLTTIDLPAVLQRHRELAVQMARGD